MITAGWAVFLSASVIRTEYLGKKSIIGRNFVDGDNDSQILQGIGIQSTNSVEICCHSPIYLRTKQTVAQLDHTSVGVGVFKVNTLIPYHYHSILILSPLSMATHNGTLHALVHNYHPHRVI